MDHDAFPVGADADTDTNVDVSTDNGLQRHGFRPSCFRFVVNSTGRAGGGVASSDPDHDAVPVGADTDTDTNVGVSTDSGLQRHGFPPSRFAVNFTAHAGGVIASSDLDQEETERSKKRP